ncbi:hypothetical protein BBJ29_002823 [Phytophthora kernoviae]|uniref:Uncharacterized protein n=1 Tax=Phytophthora kernoviae TaxID=325452 RepID=A0A3F2RQ01_9STRA|nr:hypothetical protein BBJ29_002823 [Phytophthora kernoviae]RLN62002.1 hypothetical protein BBP00_00005050 [Phytophthora kernoviae]
MATDRSTMEAKTTRFLTQFSRAVFQQWTQTSDRQQFWKDDAFLHKMLEEAVAKLPRGKLKTQLTRDLRLLEVQLASLLRELHVDYVKKQQKEEEQRSSSSFTHGALLNEELTELELTQAAAAISSDRQYQLAGVLALDAAIDITLHAADEQQEEAEKLVEKFALIAARSYETPMEQMHKRGLVLQKLAVCVQQQVDKLCSINWECSEESDAGKQALQLRALLERVVVQDAVELARVATEDEEDGGVSVGLTAPWTSFYRPEENKKLQKVRFDDEMAKIYGALLALAVYFPIELDDESDDEKDEETSGDSSSDEDEKMTSTQTPKQPRKPDAIAQAQLTTRQVLFASQMRQRIVHENGQWVVAVLSYLQSLPKPTTYLDEDEDEVFDTQDRRALLDCLGQVFTRAFANVALFDQGKDAAEEKKMAVQDCALFDAVVCLRHAAEFMRVERKCSLPAITTAMASLAGVPLPASFISWLDAEQTATPSSMFEKATQRLWKICEGQTKMVNVLLSSTDVTAEELPLIQKRYSAHLKRVAEGTLAKPSIPRTNATISGPTGSTEEATAGNSSLFFVDNAGGDAKEATSSKSKKKRANKKKRRANKGKTSGIAIKQLSEGSRTGPPGTKITVFHLQVALRSHPELAELLQRAESARMALEFFLDDATSRALYDRKLIASREAKHLPVEASSPRYQYVHNEGGSSGRRGPNTQRMAEEEAELIRRHERTRSEWQKREDDPFSEVDFAMVLKCVHPAFTLSYNATMLLSALVRELLNEVCARADVDALQQRRHPPELLLEDLQRPLLEVFCGMSTSEMASVDMATSSIRMGTLAAQISRTANECLARFRLQSRRGKTLTVQFRVYQPGNSSALQPLHVLSDVARDTPFAKLLTQMRTKHHLPVSVGDRGGDTRGREDLIAIYRARQVEATDTPATLAMPTGAVIYLVARRWWDLTRRTEARRGLLSSQRPQDALVRSLVAGTESKVRKDLRASRGSVTQDSPPRTHRKRGLAGCLAGPGLTDSTSSSSLMTASSSSVSLVRSPSRLPATQEEDSLSVLLRERAAARRGKELETRAVFSSHNSSEDPNNGDATAQQLRSPNAKLVIKSHQALETLDEVWLEFAALKSSMRVATEQLAEWTHVADTMGKLPDVSMEQFQALEAEWRDRVRSTEDLVGQTRAAHQLATQMLGHVRPRRAPSRADGRITTDKVA